MRIACTRAIDLRDAHFQAPNVLASFEAIARTVTPL
jgi:hypothetical protein